MNAIVLYNEESKTKHFLTILTSTLNRCKNLVKRTKNLDNYSYYKTNKQVSIYNKENRNNIIKRKIDTFYSF